MKHSFWVYYKGVIFKPKTTFSLLIDDKKHLSLAFKAVLIPAILYTFVYIFLIFGGGKPFKPWLDIPLETYYKYNVFFCAPSMFLGWILAAGVVHSTTRFFSQKGSFEQVLCVFGFGISIASWATGIHDFISSFLGAIHFINQNEYEVALNSATIWRTLLWVQMLAYLVWFIVLFSKGVKAVYGLKNFHSLLLGFFGFLIYQLFFLIFNR